MNKNFDLQSNLLLKNDTEESQDDCLTLDSSEKIGSLFEAQNLRRGSSLMMLNTQFGGTESLAYEL
jgi:hypothetical protein